MTPPADEHEKHAFISYVHEDSHHVDQLCKILAAANVPHWRDRRELGPGDQWKRKIRQAIQSGSVAFLACFSKQSISKKKAYQNEEITLAVEEYRQRPPGQVWLIPIRFDDCTPPDWDLGGGDTLNSLNWVDLFGDNYTANAVQLIDTIKRVMGAPSLDPLAVRTAVGEAADEDRPALLRRLTKEMIPDPQRQIELDGLIAQEVSRILAAMRDPERFPASFQPGTNDEQLVQAASQADDFWRLVEPFCWSLSVAARWAAPAALAPWATGIRAFCAEASKVEGGVQALVALKHIPCLAAVLVAAISTSGQKRWDNFKTLLVDPTVTSPYARNLKIPLLEAEHPWAAFTIDWLPQILAQAVKHDQDFAAAWSAFQQREVGRYHTPIAEWCYRILRPLFEEQFPDEESYAGEFDRAEVMLGIVNEDLGITATASNPERPIRFRNKWFGRSAWRARREGDATQHIAQEQHSQGSSWPPLSAGLFGGSLDRAGEATRRYSETFHEFSRSTLF